MAPLPAVILALLGSALARPPAEVVGGAPPTPLSCDYRLAALASDWRQSQVAADPFAARDRFTRDWPAVPAECRRGDWYLLAARALGRTPTRTLGTPDGIVLHTTREALERGLEVEPHHPGLTAFLAFGAGVGADVPPVPQFACASLPPGDDQLYVCGVTLLAAGAAPEAVLRFAAIADPTPYPDVGLRWREAAAKAGTPAALPPAVDQPPSDATCAAFGATDAECARIREGWAALPVR